MPVNTTVCTQADHGVLTQLKKQQRHCLFPYHKVRSKSHRWSSGLYGRTRGKHANSQTTIWSTHTISCEKCKLNPCIKTDNLLLPLALQPIVGFGLSNNAPQFFTIYHQHSPSSHSRHLNISFSFVSILSCAKQRKLFPKTIHFN